VPDLVVPAALDAAGCHVTLRPRDQAELRQEYKRITSPASDAGNAAQSLKSLQPNREEENELFDTYWSALAEGSAGFRRSRQEGLGRYPLRQGGGGPFENESRSQFVEDSR